MSKSAGQPLYKFLGGYLESVPAYVTGGYYREGQGIPELVKEVQGYIEQGYNAIKLKVGGRRLSLMNLSASSNTAKVLGSTLDGEFRSGISDRISHLGSSL